MAARVNKIRHDDETRAKIQTSQLINRLTGHALGEIDLAPTQVKSIEILLRKTLPDLSAVEHGGDMTLRHEDALEQLDGPPERDSEETP
jgi:hypothetical protein